MTVIWRLKVKSEEPVISSSYLGAASAQQQLSFTSARTTHPSSPISNLSGSKYRNILFKHTLKAQLIT